MAELFCEATETFPERMSRFLRSSWVAIVRHFRGAVAIAEGRSHLEECLRGRKARLQMLLRTSPHSWSRLPGDRLDLRGALPGRYQDLVEALAGVRRLRRSRGLAQVRFFPN